MTPEAVEAVFYKTYGEGEAWTEPQKPLVQRDLKRKCWQAVIDHIEKDSNIAWNGPESSQDALQAYEPD